MKSEQLASMAAAFDPYRAVVLTACGTHDTATLPLTEDSLTPYCLLCFSLFSPSGAILNPLLQPLDPSQHVARQL